MISTAVEFVSSSTSVECGGGGAQALLDSDRHLPARETRAAAVHDQPVGPDRQLEGERRGAAVLRVLGERRRRGVELQDRVAGACALIAPIANVGERARPHAAGRDQRLDPVACQPAAALPAAQPAIGVAERQQWRDEQRLQSADPLRRIAADRAVDGVEPAERGDRADLVERAPRQGAPVIADEIAPGADEPALREQAPRPPVGQEQAGRGQRRPCAKRGHRVGTARGMAIEPGGVRPDRLHQRRPFGSLAREKRRMDQPRHQPRSDRSGGPRRSARRFGVGRQPLGQDAPRGRPRLVRRSGQREIVEPGEAVDRVLEGRGEARGRREIDLADRRLHPRHEEVAGAQRHPRRPMAERRGFHLRAQPIRALALGRASEQFGRNAEAVGEGDQPLARVMPRRAEAQRHQRAVLRGRRGIGFGRPLLFACFERTAHQCPALGFAQLRGGRGERDRGRAVVVIMRPVPFRFDADAVARLAHRPLNSAMFSA